MRILSFNPERNWTGGKSELHRARRSITRSPGNGKESAAERETTSGSAGGKGEKVSAGKTGGSVFYKAEGKSSPVFRVTGAAW